MKVAQFVKQHRDEWKELEEMTTVLRKRRSSLTGSDIDRFQRLYQKASQHLSYSRTYFENEDVTHYLNGLVAKSHNLLYKDQTTSMQQIRQFFAVTFIRLMAEQWKFVAAAMVLFTLGAVATFLSVMNDPLHLYSVLPAEMAQSVDPEQLGAGHDSIDGTLFSAAIMTNNIQVAILAFAGGLAFGLITVYILILNGMIVGGLAALFWHYGMTYEFWAYIVPHGMIELAAIFIAGGSGLLMGYKLLVPGQLSRMHQLKVHAKRSVLLLLGTIPLFIIAGAIEGFITPAALSLEAKYAVAIATVVGLILYVAAGQALLNRKKLKQEDAA